jgi:hypothetical protein
MTSVTPGSPADQGLIGRGSPHLETARDKVRPLEAGAMATLRADQDYFADDAQPMLRPEEYTLPGIEAARLPTEQEYLAETVKQAEQGNTQAATEVLAEFIAIVDRHTEKTWLGAIPWPCARFVADKLRSVLKRDPLDAAVNLGIRSSRPAKAGVPQYKDIAVAGFYFLLVRAGVAPKAAKALISASIGASDDVIEDAAKQYPGFQYRDRFTVEILVELAAAYRGKIAEIIAARKLRLS